MYFQRMVSIKLNDLEKKFVQSSSAESHNVQMLANSDVVGFVLWMSGGRGLKK